MIISKTKNQVYERQENHLEVSERTLQVYLQALSHFTVGNLENSRSYPSAPKQLSEKIY